MSVGTLELLSQKKIISRDNELNLPDENIVAQNIWSQENNAELEDSVDAVKDAKSS